MYDADLLIAGGGPAGLATALHAIHSGLSVVIAEPRDNPIDKACGEGLMPGGLAALAALDIDPVGVCFRGIAYLQGARRVEAPFRAGPGRGVRRTELHHVLHAAAKLRGAQWTTTRVTEVHQDADGVSAAGVRARWMVGADGLHSRVRAAVGIPAYPGSPRRFGVRWHFHTPAWSEWVEVWWSARGEAYVTPVGPNLVGVAVLSAEKPDLAWFPDLLARLGSGGAGLGSDGAADSAGPGLGGAADGVGLGSDGAAEDAGLSGGAVDSAGLGAGGAADGAGPGFGARLASRVRGAGPLRQVVARRVAGRVLLVGDAAGYEDALTGEGISLAVKQAGAAIQALRRGRPQDYELAWRRITREYRLLTRGLVLATRFPLGRRAIVPLTAGFPFVFRGIVNRLAG